MPSAPPATAPASSRPTWFVLRDGASTGPFDRETLVTALARGELSPDDLAQRVGWHEWLPLRDDPDLARLPGRDGRTQVMAASNAPAGEPAAAPSARAPNGPAPRRRLGLFVALAVVAVGVGAGALAAMVLGGSAALRAMRRGGETLPIPIERLPPDTRLVLRTPLPGRALLGATTDVELTQDLASFACGAPNVLTQLMTNAESLGWSAENGGTPITSAPAVRQGLYCGEALRVGTRAEHVDVLEFRDPEGLSHTVMVLPLADGRAIEETLARADLGFLRQRYSELVGFCRTGADGTCTPASPTILLTPTAVVTGGLTSIEQFARSYASPRENLSTNVAILADLLAAGFEEATVGVHARPDTFAPGPLCSFYFPPSRIDECLPPGQERLLASIATRLRGTRFAAQSTQRQGALGARLTVLAHDADEARTVQRELEDLARDWRSHAENRATDLLEAVRDDRANLHANTPVQRGAEFVRALRGMRVERDGAEVSLVLETPLRDDERRDFEDREERVRPTREAAFAVLTAMLRDEPIPETQLTSLLGSDLATWMLLPRASAETCSTLREHLGALVARGVASEHFGLRYELEQRYADSNCVGAAVPTDLLECTRAAGDLHRLAACRFADTPRTGQVRRGLVGQWVVTDAPMVRGTRSVLDGARLEITPDEVALDMGFARRSTRLRFVAHSTDRASVRLPLGDEDLPFEITLHGDRLEATASRIGTLQLARSTFPSLFPGGAR